MNRDDIAGLFPRLRDEFEITSPADEAYNCIAWALNDTLRYWWPTEFKYPGLYWPPGIPTEVTIPAFVKLFENLLFTKCDSSAYESGYDKVALYADESGSPTHAARWWLEDGGWSSKLGEENDIRHHTLESLEGSDYGTVRHIFRRPRVASCNPPSPKE